MSVQINWETLTGGPDGKDLAETIRAFVHERFQQISFPKLIRSVEVHAFEFGTVAPIVTLKDICDPLPDFYEAAEHDADSAADGGNDGQNGTGGAERPPKQKPAAGRPALADFYDQAATPSLTRGALLGGGTNYGYFHPAFSAGLPGTSTPLAAVAGAHYQHGAHIHDRQSYNGETRDPSSPPSTGTSPSRPTSRDHSYFESRRASAVFDGQTGETMQDEPPEYDRHPEDMQVVFRASYSGDVQLSMTAEVVLDYPISSFVGIPLKLRITGITFDGVGILAYIKKRAHLCFLGPEDAEALVGSEGAAVSPDEEPGQGDDLHTSHKVGGLLEEIKIESEMGETEEGKQVLKNVGKIEKFILEQVQRIFEEEFVYPSFWTFLV